MKLHVLHLPVALCCAVLALSSCSKTEDQQDSSGSTGLFGGFLPKQMNPNVAPKYTEPTIDVLKGKLQQFPSEYPIEQYPNSKMVVAEVRPNYTSRRPNFVCLKTNDQLGNVADYYKQKLYKEGWKPQEAFENTAYSSTVWVKGNQKAEVRVCPAPNPAERVIQLLIYPANGR